MIEHESGQVITLDEITYDREALEKFVSQFGNECIHGSPKIGPNDTPTVGFNTIQPECGPDKLYAGDYPIVQNLLDNNYLPFELSHSFMHCCPYFEIL